MKNHFKSGSSALLMKSTHPDLFQHAAVGGITLRAGDGFAAGRV